MTRKLHGLLAAVVLASIGGAAHGDSYYVVVFGAQTNPPRPKYSHSWATFIHVFGNECCGPPTADPKIEWFTISWMPCKVELTPHTPFAEPGRNFDLPTTFDIVLSQCENVTAFGPYQIECKLYSLALEHFHELQSDRARYKTLDWVRDPRRVSNCIHALTVFESGMLRVRIGRTNFGEVASYFVTRSYRRWFVCEYQVHCWVADVLGLGAYPINWRTLDQGRPNLREGD
jgi:hypothetical protein